MAAPRWSSHPVRMTVATIVLVALVGGALAAFQISRRDSDRHSVQVRALWFGVDSAGTYHGGVTPVDIAAVDDDPTTPLSLDLSGLTAAGAGPMWTAATATAGTQAVLTSGIDPRDGQLTYELQEAIDGPSAGALLTVGSLAAINGVRLDEKTTMTGMVLADGSVGDVGGVPEKVRAAAAAGFTRLLVPSGQLQAADPTTNTIVDVVELGASLGIEVVPVASVAEAYAVMTGTPPPAASAAKPALNPDIADLLTRRARELNASTSSQLASLYAQYSTLAGGPDAEVESALITRLLTAADEALASNDAVLAYTAAAEAAQEVSLWAVSAGLQEAAATTPLPELVARERATAQAFHDEMLARLRTTAELPVVKVSQLPALADALSWGGYVLNSSKVVLQRLDSVQTQDELDEVARFLDVARFEAEVYMTTCVDTLPFVGNVPIADMEGSIGLLDAYADLLTYAADSNLAYVRSMDPTAGGEEYIDQLTAEAAALVDGIDTTFPNLSGPTPKVLLRLAAALELFVETTYQVNALTEASLADPDAPPNLVPLVKDSELDTQARVADQIATAQMAAISAYGIDPASLRWTSQWGAELSSRRLPDTTDLQAIHGLEIQWFSLLQSRLLLALAKAQAHLTPRRGVPVEGNA